MESVGLLSELRLATRDAHDELERRLDVPTRCGDPSGYAELLSGFWAAYAPLESAVRECPMTGATVPDWPLRVKVPWLEQDLYELGRRTPPAGRPVSLSCAEEVLGTLYVLEGATLGGALILRELARRGIGLPCRFFTSYGDRRGQMWRAFRRQAEQQELQSDLRRELAITAARRAFATIEDACRRPERD